ncbi:unnamed protein product [Arctogadus glacialis]
MVTKVRLDKMVTKINKVDMMVTTVTKIRLDKMVTKVSKIRPDKMELDEMGFRNARLLLQALGRISEKEDLHRLLIHGLGAKVLLWFGMVKGLLASEPYRNAVSAEPC